MDDIVDQRQKKPTRNKSSKFTGMEDIKKFKKKTPYAKQLSIGTSPLRKIGIGKNIHKMECPKWNNQTDSRFLESPVKLRTDHQRSPIPGEKLINLKKKKKKKHVLMDPIFKIPGRVNSPVKAHPNSSQINMLRVIDGSVD